MYPKMMFALAFLFICAANGAPGMPVSSRVCVNPWSDTGIGTAAIEKLVQDATLACQKIGPNVLAHRVSEILETDNYIGGRHCYTASAEYVCR